MATSGTRTQTLNVAQVIEHAYRRATGGVVSQISGEEVNTARQNLFLGLTSMVSDGLNLYCVRTHAAPAVVGQINYNLPSGAEDLLNAYLREGTFTDADALGVGTATLTYASATQVGAVELTLPAHTASWVIEASADGVTWTQVGALAETLTTATTVVVDVDPQLNVAYWRARQPAATVTPTACRFLSALQETLLSKLSRDNYLNLPSKGVQGRPTQYWFDKQIAPRAAIWQTSNTTDYHIVFSLQMAVEDVGDLQNTLAIPRRWLDAIIDDLTMRTFMELPKQRINPSLNLDQLQARADASRNKAANTEVDGAIVQIAVGIGAYTRG